MAERREVWCRPPARPLRRLCRQLGSLRILRLQPQPPIGVRHSENDDPIWPQTARFFVNLLSLWRADDLREEFQGNPSGWRGNDRDQPPPGGPRGDHSATDERISLMNMTCP